MKTTLLFAFALLVTLPLRAQKPTQPDKGVTPLSASPLSLDFGVTRAVVIGISDYQNLPDLKYADRDAKAFADWLTSESGGNLPPENIQLLLNQQATGSKVAMALMWLVEKSEEDDRAIIYFSGHGDVETKLLIQPGYLLCWDSPDKVYMGSCPSIADLQAVVNTLTQGNRAKVLMVTDACHAGKLAGSDINGVQVTNNNLAKPFSNEVKILSCQPNELSLEGEQWGGGRGLFSFHLVHGLYGRANQNGDEEISVREIGRFLDDVVPAQASPNHQNPVVVGDREALLSFVSQGDLVKIQEKEHQQQPEFSPSGSRGYEDVVLEKVDTSIREMYNAFQDAIAAGHLMPSAGTGKCADDYYRELIKEPSIEQLHGPMTRDFIAALADEGQQVVNKLLRTDPQIVDEAFPGQVRYAHLPAYLARAAEILGEQHYMYRYLKCKQYYFEAKTYTYNTYPGLSTDSLSQLSIRALDKALAYDSTAAYVYLEKGLNYYWKSSQWGASDEYFQKAMELSPTWVLAAYYFGRTVWHQGNTPLSISLLKEALKLDSTFLPTYERLGFFDAPEMSKHWRNLYVQKMEWLMEQSPDKIPATYYRYLGLTLHYLGKNEEAEKYLLKGAEMTNYEDPLYYKQLSFVYFDQGRMYEYCRCVRKYGELRPYDREISAELAYCGSFRKAITSASNNHQPKVELASGTACALYRVYYLSHHFKESRRVGKQHVEILEKNPIQGWYSGYIYWLYGGSPLIAESSLEAYANKVDTAGYSENNVDCPNCPFGILVLVNLAQNDLKGAEYWWEKRAKRDASYNPNAVDGFGYGLHTWLAYAQGKWHEVDSLIEHHSKVVPVDDLIEDMLLIYSMTDQVDYPIFCLEKSLSYFPNHAPLLYHLARLYIEQKDGYKKGVPLLEKALQLDGEHPVYNYHLAAAYAHLGKKEAALDYLEKALALGYDDPESIDEDARWEQLRKSKRYKDLMKKYKIQPTKN